MSEYMKIYDAEYEVLLKAARNVAETMSPEQIAELRKKCNNELWIIISNKKIIWATEETVLR